MEHPEFYQMMVDAGIWKEHNFENVPTREVGARWLAYNRIDSNSRNERMQFRLDNPSLDEWGVRVGIWTERARVPTTTSRGATEFEEYLDIIKGLR